MQQHMFVTLLLCCILAIPLSAQEDDEFPDLVGLSVPQAEAQLNQAGFFLAPETLSTDEGVSDNLNTIISHSDPDADNFIQVTVLREYNVRLIWDNQEEFADRVGLRDLDGDELFTFVNLSDQALALRNLQIDDFDIVAWEASLRANQCAQIWTTGETNPFQLPDCRLIQGANVTNINQASGQFWRGADKESFTVRQNGIHRATCEISAGSCDLWISPDPIAEELTPYLYVTYNSKDFLIYNNSLTQWMDISHLSLEGITNITATRVYAERTRDDLKRLAPGQCVRYTTTPNRTPLTNCQVIATANITEANVFWTSNFTIGDSINGENSLDCPPVVEETICLLPR